MANVFKGTHLVGVKKEVKSYEDFIKLSDAEAKKYFSNVAKASDKQRKLQFDKSGISRKAILHYESKMEQTGLSGNWNKQLNVDRNVLNQRYKIMAAYQNSASYGMKGVREVLKNMEEGTKRGIQTKLGIDNITDEQVRVVMDYYQRMSAYKRYLALLPSEKLVKSIQDGTYDILDEMLDKYGVDEYGQIRPTSYEDAEKLIKAGFRQQMRKPKNYDYWVEWRDTGKEGTLQEFINEKDKSTAFYRDTATLLQNR